MTKVITTYRLTRETAGLLAKCAEDVFDADIDPRHLATYLESPDRLMIVAVCEQQVVGQVAAYIHRHADQEPDLYIDNLGVTPAFQRRGIAHGLIDEVFGCARTMGCQQAWIVTETNNDAARALYERRGATAEPIVMFSYAL